MPASKWLRESRDIVSSIGSDDVARYLLDWFPLVDKPRPVPFVRHNEYETDPTHLIVDPHMDVLKGLCWLAPELGGPEIARALGKLAISAYRKLPGIGPRAVRVGNAAVYALGQMPGMDALGQLAMLRVKIKFGTAQKGIEKALKAAAERAGLPLSEIEELGVPAYGLTEIGRRVDTLGTHDAELSVVGIGKTELMFVPREGARAGKRMKSVPAAVKEEFAADLKELKSAAKDISAMLTAQRDRIDALFLEEKVWRASEWRARYLDHPLVGVIARRLIWQIAPAADASWDESRSAIRLEETGALVDQRGERVEIDDERAAVRLWHPVHVVREETLAWRRYLEEHRVRQPFKQAHREVYLLTDAERRTGTYSNRFGAHVIKQHQFNALARGRGWKNKLRLMVDDEYPPASREIRAHGLRAEFWVEGIGDHHGTDTNESGVFHYLATDQVRFYPADAAQASAHAYGGGYGAWRTSDTAPGLPLESIPALTFSEIMRDVDLFVGVASVGNNAEWNDGGPGGTHRDYWNRFSFGELSGTGEGRAELLKGLIPRLAIAPRCSFDGKFLRVRGDLREYKIHMGSGNILMEPNDQYLCIVPTSRAGDIAGDGKLFVPFEGDRTLAIILSKALMLAEDRSIKDPSIVRQIGPA